MGNIRQNPNGGGGGFGGSGGYHPPKSTPGGSPGLLTSTGGLFGISGLLLAPAFNSSTFKPYIIVIDPTNFNCEEAIQYTYRQEANYGKLPGEGREASIHLIILKYREIGLANFSINITVFKKLIDDFNTVQIPVSIPTIPLKGARINKFPDGRIHTVRLSPPKGVIQGERPQVTITAAANAGPFSITKLILCGNADELAEQ